MYREEQFNPRYWQYGISISGGDYDNIISSGNVVENNHIFAKAAQIERSYQAVYLSVIAP